MPLLRVCIFMAFSRFYLMVISIVISVVFIIKLDCSVCTCLTQLYYGRDVYIIYYIKNYMFQHFTLAIFSLRNVKDDTADPTILT